LSRPIVALLWSALLCCAAPCQARSIADLGEQAQTLKLSEHPQWHRLLRYRAHGSSVRSEIHSQAFFLSADGERDPQAELLATLAAFAQPLQAGDNLNDHPQCRFPARKLWLQQVLAIDDGAYAKVDCPAYRAWTLDGKVESVSMVLATGYLANPASFYGHILLKFNAPSSNTALLDNSANYGAIVPDDENPVVYVFKGVFGGYEGGFSNTEYYHHNHNYGETELRDLWEYRLDLTPDETRMVAAHAWELMGQEFTYFFFRENCAYRMAEVIDIVEGLDVMPDYRPWTIPQAVMLKLRETQHHGHPLIREVIYHPSRQTRFYRKYAELDAQGRRLVGRIVDDTAYLQSSAFAAEPVERRTQVVEALVDYYETMRDHDESAASDALNRGYRAALAARFLLPTQAGLAALTAPESPDQGRAPGVLRFGANHNETYGAGAALEVRGAYYDALDAGAGQVSHSALTMGETRLSIDDSKLRLQTLDFLRIDSVNGAASGLPGDRNSAWRVKLGLTQQHLGCDDCLVFRAEGSRGASLHLGRHVVAGVLLGGSLQDKRNDEGIAFAQATSFIDLLESSWLRARVEHRYRWSLDGELDHPGFVSFETRLKLGREWESRLRYEYDAVGQLSLLFGWYW
jgi:hypothetical protein